MLTPSKVHAFCVMTCSRSLPMVKSSSAALAASSNVADACGKQVASPSSSLSRQRCPKPRLRRDWRIALVGVVAVGSPMGSTALPSWPFV